MHRGDVLRLEAVDQLPRMVARAAFDAHLVLGVALLGRLRALVGDPFGLLLRHRLRIGRLRLVGRLPALGRRVPVRQFDGGVPVLVGDQLLDQPLGGLGLPAGPRVAEDFVAVDRDEDLVGERPLQVVLELFGLEPLAEVVRDAVVVEIDVEAPVVVHRRSSVPG